MKRTAQKSLFEKALEIAKPHVEKMNELIVLLEKWTCRRKELERIELLKASGVYVDPNGKKKSGETSDEGAGEGS